jgi:hypothetical protein
MASDMATCARVEFSTLIARSISLMAHNRLVVKATAARQQMGQSTPSQWLFRVTLIS